MRNLLWLVVVICITIWFLGLIGLRGGMELGNFHILLVIGIIIALYNIISYRKPLK